MALRVEHLQVEIDWIYTNDNIKFQIVVPIHRKRFERSIAT